MHVLKADVVSKLQQKTEIRNGLMRHGLNPQGLKDEIPPHPATLDRLRLPFNRSRNQARTSGRMFNRLPADTEASQQRAEHDISVDYRKPAVSGRM
jgi:hypothetical protein